MGGFGIIQYYDHSSIFVKRRKSWKPKPVEQTEISDSWLPSRNTEIITQYCEDSYEQTFLDEDDDLYKTEYMLYQSSRNNNTTTESNKSLTKINNSDIQQ